MKHLTIEITDKCSLNCLHCSTNSNNNGRVFLELDEIDEILDEFNNFEKVRLSGGEPFEHPYLVEIVKKIKDKNKIIEILSSGVSNQQELSKEILISLKDFVNRIVFSIYGDEDIHNKICSHNSYKILNKSVESTIEERIPFSFQTVVMKMNKNEIKNIVGYISRLKNRVDFCNPKLHILRFIKQGRGKENQQFAISGNDIKELIKRSREIPQKDIKITFGCSFKEEGCIQGTGKAAVTIQREKITCSALKYSSKQKIFACKERW